MYGLIAVAVAIGLVGVSQPLMAVEPLLTLDNFYVFSDTSTCVAGAICTEDVFCNTGDIAVGGGLGLANTGQGLIDNEMLRLDHRLNPPGMGGVDKESWIAKIKNSGQQNTEMTVSVTCLNSTSTVP